MEEVRLPDGTGLSSLRDEAAKASSPKASIPSAADRDAILMEVASWVEKGDFLLLRGILSKRKREREDARLRIDTGKEVRERIAAMIRGRMENKVGDPVDFLTDVQEGRFKRGFTSFTLREAVALADKGLLIVRASAQIAGPWSNTVPLDTEYTIELTDKGEEFLAQAIEARRAETHSGSVHESAVLQGCAQNTPQVSDNEL